MTVARTLFASLLDFLAGQTADDARRAGGERELEFPTEDAPSSFVRLKAFDRNEIGRDVYGRICCVLGGIGSTSASLDVSELMSEPHNYNPVIGDRTWVLGSFVWMTLACAISASLRQACPSTRQRSRSNPARPYISRLMTLSRLTWPSTCPLLHGSVRAARTASSSRRRRTAPGR
jgi:hypothetical protein